MSCPRYFGSAVTHVERVGGIDLTWTGPAGFAVRMGRRLEWRVELGRTWSTRLMSGMGRAMPARAWHSEAMVGAMGPMAGPMLGAGRIRLHGAAPNGQHFRAAPVRIWRVTDSTATLDGIDLGRPGPLPEQARLGDFWLPQRGIFFVGSAEFDPVVVADHPDVAPPFPQQR